MPTLADCIPADKNDLRAVENAAALGYPGINPVLPQLLEWVQDINWPVARELAPLLARAGPEIVPPIRAVLNSGDGPWAYGILAWVVVDLAPHVRALLRPDIVRLANDSTPHQKSEEVDIQAQALLESWDETDES